MKEGLNQLTILTISSSKLEFDDINSKVTKYGEGFVLAKQTDYIFYLRQLVNEPNLSLFYTVFSAKYRE